MTLSYAVPNWFKYNELELAQIEKLKWLESEKIGYDIGWDRAKWLWWTTERVKWLRSRSPAS